MTLGTLKPYGLATAVACLLSVVGWTQTIPAWTPVSKWSSSSYVCPSSQAREELARRAARGDAQAQDQLGTYHLSGCSGRINKDEGIKLLERAAAQGNTHAQLRLGNAYRDGTGPSDPQKALRWLQKAAIGDNASAQNNFGVALQLGVGAPRSEDNAVRLFYLAAQQGSREAQYNLATMYDTGRGVDQDYKSARYWYESAADDEESDPDAAYRLGILYEQGLGGDKDTWKAFQWYSKAAEHGSFYAALRLATGPLKGVKVKSEVFLYLAGIALAGGRGVDKDEPRGFSYVKKSADMAYQPALFQLAVMYDAGRGTPKDEAKALSTYEQVMALNPKDDVAYNNYAWILVTAENQKLRDPHKALPYALKSVEMGGNNKAFEIDTLARVYFMLGDVDKAIDLQKKAIALAPDRENYQKALNEYQDAKAHRAAK